MSKLPRDHDGLSPQEARFCEYLALGHSQAAAFRLAWPNSRANDKTAVERASRIAARGNVRARMQKLLKSADVESIISIGEHVLCLKERSDACWRDGEKTIAERYDKQLGVILAHMQQLDHNPSDLTDEELIRALSGGNSDRAEMLRQLLPSEERFVGNHD